MPDYRARAAALQRHTHKDWCKIEAKAGARSARLDIFDEIGFFGTTAKDFLAEVKALDAEQIDVHINSPGGEAYDALAIYNTLRDHPAKVVVTVDGVAASSASVIAMAGDEVVMNRGSEMMVHHPFGMAVGSAEDMRGLAVVLDKASDSLASIYAGKAGGTVAQWLDVMGAETWYSAQEAVDAGLADRVVEPAKDVAEVKAQFDFTIYAYAGRADAPAPKIEPQTPAATASGPTKQKEQDDMSSLMDNLRQKLGIADDSADEASILAALDEALAERADTPQPQNNAGPPKDIQPKDIQKLAAAAGAVIVDKGVWDEAQSKIQQGVDAARKLREQERNQILDKAVEDGRIPPASRDHWANLYDRDPQGTGEVVASLRKNLVPVQALGYAGDGDSDDLGEFAGLFPKER